MAHQRLRSNVQVRAAGIDSSFWLLIFGLAISGVLLLTMIGTDAKSQRRQDRRSPAPASRADL